MPGTLSKTIRSSIRDDGKHLPLILSPESAGLLGELEPLVIVRRTLLLFDGFQHEF